GPDGPGVGRPRLVDRPDRFLVGEGEGQRRPPQPAQASKFLARAGFPQANLPIASYGEALAIRGEGGVGNAGAPVDFPSRRRLPGPWRSVRATRRDEHLAIGREGQAPGRFTEPVAAEDLASRRRLPQAERAILPGAGNELAVGRQRDGTDGPVVARSG